MGGSQLRELWNSPPSSDSVSHTVISLTVSIRNLEEKIFNNQNKL